MARMVVAMGLIEGLLGESPGIEAVRDQVARLLRQSGDRRLPPVLICGETGTGKGLLARAIHQAGPRSKGPFVDVNCAAIPENLLEAEMFGFERGAFTDAKQPKIGLFQAAHGGTIFLDEVGLLPEALQAKLLKVIDERASRRLGSTRSEPVDAWIIAATNEDLAAAVRHRRFREDLYHRMAVLMLALPPLRDRGEDVLLLADHFLARACADYDLFPKTLGADARSALLAYDWPGNIRELSNVVERLALTSEGSLVSADMLGLSRLAVTRPPESAREEPVAPLDDTMGDVEREHLLRALEATNWNISRAATALRVSRNTLRYRIEKHGLRPGMSPPRARRRVLHPTAPASAAPASGTTDAPGPSRVRWEQRRITLLRASLVAGPAEASATSASRVPEVLVEKVQSFAGRVEELSPTGIVAAFGLEPIEDAPRNAAHAAMAIQKAAERSRRGGVDLTVKVGIHVGQFLVSEAGGVTQIDLDAKREAWIVLEALLARGEPDSILISETAAAFLERRFDLTPLGAIKGAPASAYQLAGRERGRLGLGRPMARFVGRRRDLDLLESRLESVMTGHGQIVGIVGEAGIGKSRLIFEFRQSLRQQSITYLEGRCLSYGSSVPYLPVLEILRQNFGITDVHGPSAVRDKIGAGLAALGMDAEEWAPYFLQLLGVKEGTEMLASLSPEAIKSRTVEAMRQLSLKGSRQRPIVFALEDLHWIDKSSEECVAAMVQGLAGAPVLFLATYRPGYRPGWMDKSFATQIALQPLSEEDSMTVVRSVLRSEPVPDPLTRRILDKAEGNPFFLEELSRSVREQGDLEPMLAVPDTIQEVLLARIRRLPDGAKQALQTAAVLGREASLPLLRSIWDGPDALEEHLRDLMRLEFLYEQNDGSEPVYSFKHALTQEVAYASLPVPRRQALHLAAARALETIYADRLPDVFERLAYHFSKTDHAEKAVEYLTLFARSAATLYAHEEAVRALQEAQLHVQNLPLKDRDRLRLDLVLRHASSLFPLGRIHETLELLLPQREPLARLQDADLAGHYYFLLGRTYSFLADVERAAQNAQRAIAEADRCGDATTKGKAYCLLAQDGPLAGQALEGIAQGRQAVELLEGTEERWWLGHAHWVVALNYLQIGSIGPALEALGQADAIAKVTGDPRLQTVAAWCAGIIHAIAGESERAISECRQAVERAPDPLNRAVAVGWLGFAYMEKGDAAEAIPLLEQVAAQFSRFGYRPLQGWFTAFLAEAYRISGQFDVAREVATKSLQIATDSQVGVATGWARLSLGRIANATRAHAEAESHLKTALDTFAGIQSRYEMGRTQMDLAIAAHAQGKVEAAAASLRSAHDQFKALSVPNYLRRVQQLASDLAIQL
jgi:DNA-binding NtrC family response regulator/tetratricopeptide (TPR) repeat protein